MRCRTVYEVADENGKWMVTDRFLDSDKNVQLSDRDAIEIRINRLERDQIAIENRRWFKPLRHTKGLSEILVSCGGKAIRMHCFQNGQDIIVVNGYIKKNGSNQTLISEAGRLKKLWEAGKLQVREIPNAHRL